MKNDKQKRGEKKENKVKQVPMETSSISVFMLSRAPLHQIQTSVNLLKLRRDGLNVSITTLTREIYTLEV